MGRVAWITQVGPKVSHRPLEEGDSVVIVRHVALTRRMEPRAEACRWPLEAGKGKEVDCPLESPEGVQPSQTLLLAQGDPFWNSDLQNHRRVSVWFFRLPSLW